MPSSSSHHADRWLGLTIFGLLLFGIIMVYSASVIAGHTLFNDDRFFVKRQLVWAFLGVVGLLVMANIDYRVWKKWAGWMLGITIVLLISVFLFSKGEINGAHRWILLFGQTFQPSELAKLTFIIYLSAWLAERKSRMANISETFFPYLGVLGVVSILMLKEPDFGTLSIILAAAVAIYFVAGLTWKQAMLGILVFSLAITVAVIASPYRRGRLITFLDRGQNTATSSSSYQVKNIAIAVGSGGWQGLGFGQSKQKRLFLPEPYTDSIFAVITEELGFVAAEFLILVYCFLFYRGYLIAARSPDRFGQLLAVGITTWFAFQALINLGSMVSLVPLVGVPLPFISYGGTNLVISLIGVGLLLNISRFADMGIFEAAVGRKVAKGRLGTKGV